MTHDDMLTHFENARLYWTGKWNKTEKSLTMREITKTGCVALTGEVNHNTEQDEHICSYSNKSLLVFRKELSFSKSQVVFDSQLRLHHPHTPPPSITTFLSISPSLLPGVFLFHFLLSETWRRGHTPSWENRLKKRESEINSATHCSSSLRPLRSRNKFKQI